MSDRLTLATSTGLPFLVLAFHIATGILALAAGFVAVAARKGGTWHRRGGTVFTCAMIATGIAIVALSTWEGKSPGGGLLVIYLVATAWSTVQPAGSASRRVDIVLMTLAFVLAAAGYLRTFVALGAPGDRVDDVPVGAIFISATVVLLAAIGDLKMVRAGGYQGSQRLARHLWRMCVALFIASGSFFIGQMHIFPKPIRIVPLLVALGVSPLVVLVYWMRRVRARRDVHASTIPTPVALPLAP